MAEEQMPIVQELIDREKIREVVHRYCWAVDRGTLEEVMAFFDDDSCELRLIPGKTYLGKAAVQKWYDIYIQNRMEVLRHLVHNQVITIEGDTAVGPWANAAHAGRQIMDTHRDIFFICQTLLR